LDQIRQLKKNLITELELSHDEVEIFMSLIKAGKTSSNNFIIHSNYTKEKTIEICKELEQKGMIIEISNNEFQVLHPRFAIVNRYKRMCKEKETEFKKNTKIDNIGLMLEKYQNNND
jgi:sugar-specific transcriptional regulator TrmB